MEASMRKRAFFAGALLAAFGCEVAPVERDVEVEYLNAPEAEDTGLPFSTAVRVNDTLYLSGSVGVVPATGKLVEGGIRAETRQTLENISGNLQRFDSSMDDVVKCTVFLADIEEWAAMNDVYRTFFKNPPARSALGASGLALGARVEIECIAVIPSKS